MKGYIWKDNIGSLVNSLIAMERVKIIPKEEVRKIKRISPSLVDELFWLTEKHVKATREHLPYDLMEMKGRKSIIDKQEVKMNKKQIVEYTIKFKDDNEVFSGESYLYFGESPKGNFLVLQSIPQCEENPILENIKTEPSEVKDCIRGRWNINNMKEAFLEQVKRLALYILRSYRVYTEDISVSVSSRIKGMDSRKDDICISFALLTEGEDRHIGKDIQDAILGAVETRKKELCNAPKTSD